jgi:tetratricopeptide (TPR) repeat protein
VFLSSIRFLRQVVLLSISLGQVVALAQPALESLAKLEKRMPADTAAISQGLLLTRELLKTNPREAGQALERLRVQAEAARHYPALLAYAGQLMQQAKGTADYKSAVATLEALLEKYKESLSAEQALELRIWLADGAEALKETGKARALVTELLPLARRPGQRAQLYLIRASCLQTEAAFSESTKEYLLALDYYLPAGDLDHVVRIYNNLGLIHASLEEFDKAIEYLQTALPYARKLGDAYRLAGTYINLGTVYRRQARYPQALEQYQLALRLAEKNSLTQPRAQSLMNIGIVYNKIQRYAEALRYHEQALALSRQHDLRYGVALSYINRASVYTNLRQYPRAKVLYDSALVEVKKLRLPQEESRIYEQYAELYELQGQYEQSLVYFKRFKGLRDSLFSEEKQKQISELMVKYETEKKTADLAMMDLELHNERTTNYILLGLVGLVLLGSAALWQYYRQRDRNLRLLYEKNIQLMQLRDKGPAPELARPEARPEAPVPAAAEIRTEEDRLEQLYSRIVALLEEQKVHRDPKCSITQLAQLLHSNERMVSQAIKAGSGMNFNTLLNTYRTHDACRLIRELGARATIDEVWDACGFNSRSSFYAVFSAQTGLTPGQFIRQSSRPS